jgi:two-component system invasion response regulator UvrY
MRIVIADDHPLVRRGLRSLVVEAEPGWEIEEAGDAPELMAVLAAAPADVILLDLNMPGTRGLEVLERVAALHPAARVLVVSSYAEPEFALRALQLGACGYLGKESADDEAIEAIRSVAVGRIYVSSQLGPLLRNALDRSEPAPALSSRELAVLRGLAQGLAIKELAAALGLSPKTVATYRMRLMAKTGLKNDVEIARYALHHRLVE